MPRQEDLVSRIIDKAEKILGEYPLCNDCLGRLFAKYGIGLSNYERGLSIKTFLAFKLHAEYTQGLVSKERLHILARNSGEGVLSLYKKLFNEDLKQDKCFICGGGITRYLIRDIAEKACEIIRKHGSRSFVIGISMDKFIVNNELEILVKHGLETSESIRRELKREVGKEIKSICSIEPDFTSPDIVLIIRFDSDFKYEVFAQPNPVFYECKLLKTGRGIPFYPLRKIDVGGKHVKSMYEIIGDIFKEAIGSREIVIHGVGFEGLSTRILGLGIDVVIEARSPQRRIDPVMLGEIAKSKTEGSNVVIEIRSILNRNSVVYMKELSRSARKLYRVSIYVPNGIELGELDLIERYFTGSAITQVVSERSSYPKKTRRKKVYLVKTIQVSRSVFEAIIMCDIGLSIRGLVKCESKEVVPCFSSVLNKTLIPLEIDLVNVLR
ncbi:MAG: tRNA pseudouridine(54/55) synthase Pus10 [Desulfurococcaceae archaeon]